MLEDAGWRIVDAAQTPNAGFACNPRGGERKIVVILVLERQ